MNTRTLKTRCDGVQQHYWVKTETGTEPWPNPWGSQDKDEMIRRKVWSNIRLYDPQNPTHVAMVSMVLRRMNDPVETQLYLQNLPTSMLERVVASLLPQLDAQGTARIVTALQQMMNLRQANAMETERTNIALPPQVGPALVQALDRFESNDTLRDAVIKLLPLARTTTTLDAWTQRFERLLQQGRAPQPDELDAYSQCATHTDVPEEKYHDYSHTIETVAREIEQVPDRFYSLLLTRFPINGWFVFRALFQNTHPDVAWKTLHYLTAHDSMKYDPFVADSLPTLLTHPDPRVRERTFERIAYWKRRIDEGNYDDLRRIDGWVNLTPEVVHAVQQRFKDGADSVLALLQRYADSDDTDEGQEGVQ